MTRRLLILALCTGLAVTAAAAAAPGAVRTTSGTRGLPCGIAKIVDALLCPERSSGPSSPEPPASSQPGGAASSGERGGTPSALATPRRTALRFDPGHLIVQFRRGTADFRAEAVLARSDLEVVRRLARIRAYVVRVDPAAGDRVRAELRASSGVESVEREILAGLADTTPNDSLWALQPGLRTAGFPRAWDVSRGSSDVVVAVVDTGVDPSHPDLAGALVPGYDFVNRDADPRDDEGHGTAVAGVIAARTNNGRGIAGVCWSCRVMPVKVLDAHGSGGTGDVAAGVIWAADHGARVINLSLGAPETTVALSDAVAYATRRGALVVAAAGNEGSASLFFPAAEPDAFGVAATDLRDRLYPWSNRGAWVRAAAPGCNVAPLAGSDYGDFCGTSAATPVVSGLAALALSVKPNAGVSEVESVIEQTATRVADDPMLGRVDAAGALARIASLPAPPPKAAPPVTVLHKGVLTRSTASRAYTRLVGAGPLTATLTFAAGPTLTLSLGTDRGESIERVSGQSPLRIARTVTAANLRLVVSGPPTRFTLTLTHAPVVRRTVRPSRVPPGPPVSEAEGAQVGRPAPPPKAGVGAASILLDGAEPLEPPIVAAVNAVRRAHGLRALRFSPALSRSADAHAASMAIHGYFSHAWSDGTAFATWIRRYYAPLRARTWSVGENLLWAAPSTTPDATVKGWLASPPHRRNLLERSWRQIGIGVVRATKAGGVYGGYDVEIVVANFGTR